MLIYYIETARETHGIYKWPNLSLISIFVYFRRMGVVIVLSHVILISKTIYPTVFLKLSYYLNNKWVISSTNSKNLTMTWRRVAVEIRIRFDRQINRIYSRDTLFTYHHDSSRAHSFRSSLKCIEWYLSLPT